MYVYVELFRLDESSFLVSALARILFFVGPIRARHIPLIFGVRQMSSLTSIDQPVVRRRQCILTV